MKVKSDNVISNEIIRNDKIGYLNKIKRDAKIEAFEYALKKGFTKFKIQEFFINTTEKPSFDFLDEYYDLKHQDLSKYIVIITEIN